MKESLYRLIYVSQNCIEGDDAHVRGEIDSILDTARVQNQKLGVTGALMFNAGCFAQVLEGELEHVEETFERIQYDQRHQDVNVLLFEPTDTRAFEDWSMAYVGADADARQEFADVGGQSGIDASALPAGRVFAILQEHLHDREQKHLRTKAA